MGLKYDGGVRQVVKVRAVGGRMRHTGIKRWRRKYHDCTTTFRNIFARVTKEGNGPSLMLLKGRCEKETGQRRVQARQKAARPMEVVQDRI